MSSGEGMTSQQWSMTVTPVVAAITTLCASTALAGVIDGLRWLGYAGVAVIVVTAVGLGLRAIRTPVLVVGLVQMFAVLCLLVALFTNSGILGLFPGPAAISELGDVLRQSVDVVRTGVPPVQASAAVLCLVVIAIGLVAVLVDTLAVAAGTPAACGLVLLCVYAVPASLADQMLPWWSFVLGASSFAVLLAVDGAHRHQQWRNRPALPGTGRGVGSPAAHVGAALVLALVAGGTITAIGTVGGLPGGSGGNGSGGLGLKPFTSLRGMLDQGNNQELFRVRGLGQDAQYMRAITLPVYDRNGGWLERPMPQGVSADRDLPVAPGSRAPSKTTNISIETVGTEDLFAGTYGNPKRIRGLPQGMRYDPGSGMVYSQSRRKFPRYTVETDLSQPDVSALRSAGTDYRDIDPIYLQRDNIPQRVVDLAKQITADFSTPFDKAQALKKHFEGNGFVYRLQTAQGSDTDALVDFLFRSKAGFCEQYASAMAILARAIGLPSRVAIGYTAGFASSDYRSITTQDAHAWVEIYFPGVGWTFFDPTPLTDGRTYTPPYANATGTGSDLTEDQKTGTTTTGGPTNSVSNPNKEDRPDPDSAGGAIGSQPNQKPAWIGWTTGSVAVLALLLSVIAALAAGGLLPGQFARRRRALIPIAVICWLLAIVLAAALVSWWLSFLIVALTVAAAPGFVRQWQRHARRHAIHKNQPSAPTAAWDELMAESVDRGAEVIPAETVRTTARRLAREHDLDDDGKRALRTLVGAVERSWYGGRSGPDPELLSAFDGVVAGLRRSSPLALRARLLPRSVLRGRKKADQS
jgi:transglutaminase-like putative cysteine protease